MPDMEGPAGRHRPAPRPRGRAREAVPEGREVDHARDHTREPRVPAMVTTLTVGQNAPGRSASGSRSARGARARG